MSRVEVLPVVPIHVYPTLDSERLERKTISPRVTQHVHDKQRGAHHGNTKVGLQIAVAVPVHHGDSGARAHIQIGQRIGQLCDAPIEITVLLAHLAAICDLLAAMQAHRAEQQLLDEQGIGISRWCRLKQEPPGIRHVEE